MALQRLSHSLAKAYKLPSNSLPMVQLPSNGPPIVQLLSNGLPSDGEDGSVVAEGQRRDGGGISVELAETLLVESVPDVDETVRPARCESVVLIVECWSGDGGGKRR